MFKPTHVVNGNQLAGGIKSFFATGEEVMFVREGGWSTTTKKTAHPVTGFPCAVAIYVGADGGKQAVPSYAVDEIEKEGV